ncbi:hypothetical protein [Miltoncostaea oceani]|uniref:hypothetical protein n=1 Tax=Miltoncostaea oceani TaxID=2843216 RepID=UPI001C3C2C64|nr:hypothetical protein [Miltoncostaea oceani]
MPPTPPPPANRIAVIVVPGVGDHPAGEAVTQVAERLTTDARGYRWMPTPDGAATHPPLTVEVPSERSRRGERYDAERRRLVRHDGTEIDLVEMRWSDLSSFPGNGLRAFFGAAFGLALQIATAGMEATPPRGGRRQRIANLGMNIASWWAAAIVIPVTLMAALAGTALWLAVDEPLGIPDWMAAVSVFGLGGMAVLALGKGLGNGGWTYDGRLRPVGARWTTWMLFLAGVGLCVWRIVAAGSVEGGLGQTVIAVAGFAVRPAWLGAAVIVAATVVALLVHFLSHRDAVALRASFTSIATSVLSPLLVALLGTILVAGIGAVAFTSAEDATWGAPAPDLRCFDGAADWTWGQDCGETPVRWEASLADAIPQRLEQAEAAMAVASARRPGVVARGGDPDALAAIAADEDEAQALADATAEVEDDVGVAPTTWAQDVLEDTMLPLVPLMIVLLVVAGIAGLWLLVLKPEWLRGEVDGRRRHRPGARLDWVLGALGGIWGAGIVAVLGLVGSALTIICYLVVDPRDPTGPDAPGWVDDLFADIPPSVWALTGTLILGGLVLARALPLDPRQYKDDVGGALKALRTFLDIPYDVATYLRIDGDGDGVRSRTIARYRCLLRRVGQEGYTHVVFAAHSQGSMYTLATLFGDEHRRDAEPGGTYGIRPWEEIEPQSHLASVPVGVLTFGCPIRQTYEERLPGQYTWPGDAGVEARIALLDRAWVNAYRPRDYIGRAVFEPPTSERANRQMWGTRRRDFPSPGLPVDRIDVCIAGSGSHTGYFGDPDLIDWLDYLLTRVTGAAEPPVPSGYTLRVPTAAT